MQAYELNASEASEHIATKALSCEELARSTLDHIESREPNVKAWSFVDRDLVIRGARELDKVPPRGPLHGLTLGVKDIIDTKDMPTQYNSPLYANHHPTSDAACVAIMRSMGSLVLGKTDTVEFAAGGRNAATRNPHNLKHSPGGSSSGSAAAVADQQVQLAFGTQTRGSHIRPAAFNGVYAIKPTYGIISSRGVRPYAPSFDTVGWYGRSVQDLRLVARAFQLHGLDQLKPVAIKGLKVGLCRSPAWNKADLYARAALMQAAHSLEAEGATIIELALPESFSRLDEIQQLICCSEGRATFLEEYIRCPGLLHENLIALIDSSQQITTTQLVEAYDLSAQSRWIFDNLFGEYLDVILTPASTGEAPEGVQFTGDPAFNTIWTLLHAPCVCIPVGKSPNNLPLAVQLVGPRFYDGPLLSIADTCAPAIHSNVELALK
jgi:Asp-tRNA(Asn)/Glu-tRNA(Gln) amidotransferase A subunit family amidase